MLRQVLLAFALLVSTAHAGEIAVIGTVAIKGPLDILVPQFSTATGHHVTVTYVSASTINKEVESGKPFDVVLEASAPLDALVNSGAAQPSTPLGSIFVELAYPASAPKPDISTPDKLKSLLVSARAISTSDPAFAGTSSLYFHALAAKLGLTDIVNAKLIKTKSGDGPKPVGEGLADIGIGMSSEVAAAPGTAGIPLDASDPKSKATIGAAVTTKAQDAAAAKALVTYLASPASAAVLRKAGYETP